MGHFIENAGQLGEEAGLFYIRGNPLSAAFGEGWFALDLRNGDGPRGFEGALVRCSFEGANAVRPEGVGPLIQRTNYLLGPTPGDWVVGVQSYEEVRYSDLWDGIDLRFYLSHGALEYDFVARPGSDVSRVAIAFEGTTGLGLDPDNGDLLIGTEAGEIRDVTPFAFQDHGAVRRRVSAGYYLSDRSTVGLDIGEYDRERTLVIDPLLYSTFVGGFDEDWLEDITLDGQGRNVMVGYSYSTNFPTTPGGYNTSLDQAPDIVVVRTTADSSTIDLSTFIGGNGVDTAWRVDVDTADRILVTGYTNSTDFPVTATAFDRTYNGGFYDAFLTVLESNGSALFYSTYLGSTGIDMGWGVGALPNGSIVVGGVAGAADFPTTEGCMDGTYVNGEAFILTIDATRGSLCFSTFLGGSDGDGIRALVVDSDGDVLVGGTTTSADFPVTEGAVNTTSNGASQDMFIARLSSDGERLVYAAALGGTGLEELRGLTLDNDGRAVVTGFTQSNDFPTTDGCYDGTLDGTEDMVVLRLSSDGSRLGFSTYIGGRDRDWGTSVRTDENDMPIVIGVSRSDDFPITERAYDATHNGLNDAVILRLESNGTSVNYSSFLGTSDSETPQGLILDGSGNLHIDGGTDATGFPVTTDAIDRTYNGGGDGFLSIFEIKLSEPPSAPRSFQAMPGDRMANLTWEGPLSDGGCAEIGFYLYRGETRDCATVRWTLGPATWETDMGLTNGRTYYYWLSAYNTAGEGPSTEAVEVMPFSPPSEPRDLRLTPGCGTVLLNWTAPSDTGGLVLEGYRVYRGYASLGLALLASIGNDTVFLDEGLENGRRYFYQVQAFHSLANGTLSTVKSVVPFGPPGVPQYFLGASGDREVNLTWIPPFDDGGSAVRGYRIFRGIGPDVLERYQAIGPSISWTDSGLLNGLEYHYAILAFNDAGDGLKTATIAVTPLGPPGPPEELSVEEGSARVRLLWLPPIDTGGAPVIGYTVSRGLEKNVLSVISSVGNVTGFVDMGLENGVTYYYSVSARTRVGEGAAAGPVAAVPMDQPSEPMGLTAEVRSGEVELAWIPPMDDGGSPIESYVVYRGDSVDGMEVLTRVGATVPGFKDSSVTNGNRYLYCIAAINLRFEGPRSDIVEAVPFGLPGEPVNLTTSPGDGQVTLAWEAPHSDGGRPVQRYNLYRGTAPGALILVREVRDARTYIDASLTNGQAYYYQLSTVTEAGEGPPTAVVSSTPLGLPGIPRDLVVVVSKDTVLVSWRAPDTDGGSPITGYALLRGTTSDNLTVIASVGNVTSYIDETVEKGRTYHYGVRAVSDVGDGQTTPAVEVKVPKAKRDGPGPGWVAAVISLVGAWRIVAGCRGRSTRGRS